MKKKQTKKVAAKAAKKTAPKKAAPKRATSLRQKIAEPVGVPKRLADALREQLAADKAAAPPPPPPPVAPTSSYAPPPVPPVPAPAIDQAWRANIDWVAAGKKAYETRMRNLAARAAGNGNGAAPAPAPAPKPARQARPVGDASDADYVLRVTAAINRSTPKGDEARCAAIVGKDLGGGWLVVATDGTRALTQKATADDAVVPHGKVKITKAGRSRFGLTLTPEIEQAFRLARYGAKKAADVTLTLDPKAKTLTITGLHLAAPITVPAPAPGVTTTTVLRCDARLLADGIGRGGRLGWEAPKDGRPGPYVIDPNAQLRYVFMPIVGKP